MSGFLYLPVKNTISSANISYFHVNFRGKQQKTYLSFGTDFGHMIDVTESLIIGNKNIDQNVELECIVSPRILRLAYSVANDRASMKYSFEGPKLQIVETSIFEKIFKFSNKCGLLAVT